MTRCWPVALIALLMTQAGIAGNARKPLMKDFIGLNGHFQFKPELYRSVCRLVRNYHNIDWDVAKPGDPITFPRCVNKVYWDKHVYGKWVQHAFEVDLCAQFGRFGASNADYAKLWQGHTAWFNEYGYAMASFLGPSGANKLVTSIEIGNEPGNGFDDALYRELFVQMARGIRRADPKIRIVTATAHAGPAGPYAKSLDESFSSDEIKALFDVINLHVYAVLPKQTGRNPWARSYPEDPALSYLHTVDAAIAWRDRHTADKEIWITEFGYDACTPEAMKHREGWAKTLNWTGVTDEQQAQYLLRSFFCFAERDIQRAYIYFFNDADKASVHAASGLTRHFKPKPSFWAVKHFYETLGEYRFKRVVHRQPGTLHAYEFEKGSDPSQSVWALWSPSGDGRTGQVTLSDLPGSLKKLERMPLDDHQPDLVEHRIINPDKLEVTISESPIYLMFEQ